MLRSHLKQFTAVVLVTSLLLAAPGARASGMYTYAFFRYMAVFSVGTGALLYGEYKLAEYFLEPAAAKEESSGNTDEKRNGSPGGGYGNTPAESYRQGLLVSEQESREEADEPGVITISKTGSPASSVTDEHKSSANFSDSFAGKNTTSSSNQITSTAESVSSTQITSTPTVVSSSSEVSDRSTIQPTSSSQVPVQPSNTVKNTSANVAPTPTPSANQDSASDKRKKITSVPAPTTSVPSMADKFRKIWSSKKDQESSGQADTVTIEPTRSTVEQNQKTTVSDPESSAGLPDASIIQPTTSSQEPVQSTATTSSSIDVSPTPVPTTDFEKSAEKPDYDVNSTLINQARSVAANRERLMKWQKQWQQLNEQRRADEEKLRAEEDAYRQSLKDQLAILKANGEVLARAQNPRQEVYVTLPKRIKTHTEAPVSEAPNLYQQFMELVNKKAEEQPEVLPADRDGVSGKQTHSAPEPTTPVVSMLDKFRGLWSSEKQPSPEPTGAESIEPARSTVTPEQTATGSESESFRPSDSVDASTVVTPAPSSTTTVPTESSSSSSSKEAPTSSTSVDTSTVVTPTLTPSSTTQVLTEGSSSTSNQEVPTSSASVDASTVVTPTSTPTPSSTTTVPTESSSSTSSQEAPTSSTSVDASTVVTPTSTPTPSSTTTVPTESSSSTSSQEAPTSSTSVDASTVVTPTSTPTPSSTTTVPAESSSSSSSKEAPTSSASVDTSTVVTPTSTPTPSSTTTVPTESSSSSSSQETPTSSASVDGSTVVTSTPTPTPSSTATVLTESTSSTSSQEAPTSSTSVDASTLVTPTPSSTTTVPTESSSSTSSQETPTSSTSVDSSTVVTPTSTPTPSSTTTVPTESSSSTSSQETPTSSTSVDSSTVVTPTSTPTPSSTSTVSTESSSSTSSQETPTSSTSVDASTVVTRTSTPTPSSTSTVPTESSSSTSSQEAPASSTSVDTSTVVTPTSTPTPSSTTTVPTESSSSTSSQEASTSSASVDGSTVVTPTPTPSSTTTVPTESSSSTSSQEASTSSTSVDASTVVTSTPAPSPTTSSSFAEQASTASTFSSAGSPEETPAPTPKAEKDKPAPQKQVVNEPVTPAPSMAEQFRKAWSSGKVKQKDAGKGTSQAPNAYEEYKRLFEGKKSEDVTSGARDSGHTQKTEKDKTSGIKVMPTTPAPSMTEQFRKAWSSGKVKQKDAGKGISQAPNANEEYKKLFEGKKSEGVVSGDRDSGHTPKTEKEKTSGKKVMPTTPAPSMAEQFRKAWSSGKKKQKDAGKGTSQAPSSYEQFMQLFEKDISDDEAFVDDDEADEGIEDDWNPQPDESDEQDESEAAVESNVVEEEIDEQEDEDETEAVDDGSKAPDVVPVLEDSTLGTLAVSQDISLAAGMLSMDGMSSLRNLMGLYRTGRMFDYGQVSLDDLTASEMLASTNEGDSVPVRDRRSNDWHSFVQVYGQQGSYKGLQSFADASYKGYGLNTGLFSQVNEELTLGLMFGVQKVSLNRSDSLGAASLESVRFGPFLSWSKNDWHLDAALVVAQNQYESTRADSQGRQLKAGFSGTELNGYLALGYDLHMDHWMQGLTVTPMTEIFYSHVSHGGFREKGQSDQALKVESQSNDQLVTRFGAEISYVMPDLENPTVLNLRLGWQQQSLSTGSTSYQLPEQGAAGRFDAKGFGDSGIFYGVSFNRKMSDTSNISMNYSATRSEKGLSHGLQLHYEWKF